MSYDDRSIVISALRAAFQPAVKSLVAGQLDIYLELELSGTSVQTKVRIHDYRACSSSMPTSY